MIHLLHSCPQTTFSAGERSFSGVTKGITMAVPDSVPPFFRSLSVCISFLCRGAKWEHYEVAFVCFCVCGDPVEWTGRGPESGLQTPLQSPENHSQMVIVRVPWSVKSMHEIFLFALFMKFLVAVKSLKKDGTLFMKSAKLSRLNFQGTHKQNPFYYFDFAVLAI